MACKFIKHAFDDVGQFYGYSIISEPFCIFPTYCLYYLLLPGLETSCEGGFPIPAIFYYPEVSLSQTLSEGCCFTARFFLSSPMRRWWSESISVPLKTLTSRRTLFHFLSIVKCKVNLIFNAMVWGYPGSFMGLFVWEETASDH